MDIIHICGDICSYKNICMHICVYMYVYINIYVMHSALARILVRWGIDMSTFLLTGALEECSPLPLPSHTHSSLSFDLHSDLTLGMTIYKHISRFISKTRRHLNCPHLTTSRWRRFSRQTIASLWTGHPIILSQKGQGQKRRLLIRHVCIYLYIYMLTVDVAGAVCIYI